MPGGVRLGLAGISSTAWPGVLVGLMGSHRARASGEGGPAWGRSGWIGSG